MGKETIIRCDFPGCDRIRTETNHWFVIAAGVNTVGIAAMGIMGPKQEKLPEVPKLYMCSEGHLMQHLSVLLPKMHKTEVKSQETGT